MDTYNSVRAASEQGLVLRLPDPVPTQASSRPDFRLDRGPPGASLLHEITVPSVNDTSRGHDKYDESRIGRGPPPSDTRT